MREDKALFDILVRGTRILNWKDVYYCCDTQELEPNYYHSQWFITKMKKLERLNPQMALNLKEAIKLRDTLVHRARSENWIFWCYFRLDFPNEYKDYLKLKRDQKHLRSLVKAFADEVSIWIPKISHDYEGRVTKCRNQD